MQALSRMTSRAVDQGFLGAFRVGEGDGVPHIIFQILTLQMTRSSLWMRREIIPELFS